MANLLLQLEELTGLTAHQCAMLLGHARPTYYQYRRGGHIPKTSEYHIETMLRLPKKLLNELIQERVYGNEL